MDSHISNSMTFRWGGVGGLASRNAFFYLEGLRLAHCSVLVRFPCGKHTAVPRLDMELHTTPPLPGIHPSVFPHCLVWVAGPPPPFDNNNNTNTAYYTSAGKKKHCLPAHFLDFGGEKPGGPLLLSRGGDPP